MRLFVAIDADQACRKAFARLAAKAAPGPWLSLTPPDNLHLTLAFLGEVPGPLDKAAPGPEEGEPDGILDAPDGNGPEPETAPPAEPDEGAPSEPDPESPDAPLKPPVFERLLAELGALRFAPFGLSLGGTLLFPQPKGKKVLAADVRQGLGPLCGLAACVTGAVRRAGIPLPDRPYRPHLSLARLRPALHPEAAGEFMTRAAAVSWPPFRVDALSLCQSLPAPAEQGQCAVAYRRLCTVAAS